jgi:hypothetical protein
MRSIVRIGNTTKERTRISGWNDDSQRKKEFGAENWLIWLFGHDGAEFRR